MIILINTILIFLITLASGYGIVGLISLKKNVNEVETDYFFLIPIVGYVYTQLQFWTFYLLFEDSYASFWLTILMVIIISVIYYRNMHQKSLIKSQLKALWIHDKYDLNIFWVFLAIFIISSWQYILIGAGNYYHSGNADFFDGITGGQEYLNNVTIRAMDKDFSFNFPIQYSSQTFWHIILGNDWMDGFLNQSIYNLWLTILGIFWLTKYVFNAKHYISILIGFWCVAANFYMTTYLNGHIGSLIFLSVTPFAIGLTLKWSRGELNKYWLMVVFALFVFIQFTYREPFYFFLIPLIILVVYEKIILKRGIDVYVKNFLGIAKTGKGYQVKDGKSKVRITLLSTVLIALLLFIIFWLWNEFEPRRVSAILRTNVSWKISLYKEMLSIYWGIFPSGSTGAFSLVPFLISQALINTIGLITASFITLLAAFSFISHYKNKNRKYIILFAFFYIPFFILMRFFWGSPYFFYKFLYLTYFIVIISILIWFSENIANKKTLTARLIKLIFLVTFILNLIWNFSVGLDFFRREYNQKDAVADFIGYLKKNKPTQLGLDIPNDLLDVTFNYIFKKNDIKLYPEIDSAKNIIRVKNVKSVSYSTFQDKETVYSNDILSLEKAQKENIISIKTLYSPEYNGSVNINWIGNHLSVQRGIITSSIMDMIKFVNNQKISGKFFIDIFSKGRDVYVHYILNEILLQNKIEVVSNPSNATYFVIARVDRDNLNFETPIKIDKDFSQIYSNYFFTIYEAPKSKKEMVLDFDQKNISFISKEIPALADLIKKYDNNIYIDIQDDTPLNLYLENELKKRNVQVSRDQSKSTLFLRIESNSPFITEKSFSISNKSEKVLLKLDQNINSVAGKELRSLKLLSVPYEGRKIEEIKKKYFRTRNPYDVVIKIEKLNPQARFLRLLISPGPSIDFSDFYLSIRNSDLNYFKSYLVKSPTTIINLDLNEFINHEENDRVEIFLEGKNLAGENLSGHSLLPLEERYLLYNLYLAELTDNTGNYSANILNVFNSQPHNRFETFLNSVLRRETPKDILDQSDKKIILGLGWYPYEVYNNESFRWIGLDSAEIVVDKNPDGKKSLMIDLEPGPSCASKPLILNAFVNNKFVKKYVVDKRNNIEIPFESSDSKAVDDNGGEQKIIRLESENGNVRIPTDPRIMKYRAFNISFHGNREPDIISPGQENNLKISSGWYPYEIYKNQAFRWVGKDPVSLIIDANYTAGKKINFNLEPGPSCADKPLRLNVFLNKKFLNKYIITGRQIIEVPIPEALAMSKNKEIELSLQSENKSITVPSDPRILQYRVFGISMNEKKEPDIIAPGQESDFKISSGWYSYEVYQNQIFRWIGKNPAEIFVKNKESLNSVYFDAEPGPGCGGKELSLDLLVNNKTVKNVKMSKRETITLELKKELMNSKKEWFSIKLVPHSGNKSIKEDTRILNLRVFSISGK